MYFLRCSWKYIQLFMIYLSNKRKIDNQKHSLMFGGGCAHIFPDELGNGAGQHEAGDGTAHDVEKCIHDPCAGGWFDRRTEGTAEWAGGWSTAATYLWRRAEVSAAEHDTERLSQSVSLVQVYCVEALLSVTPYQFSLFPSVSRLFSQLPLTPVSY